MDVNLILHERTAVSWHTVETERQNWRIWSFRLKWNIILTPPTNLTCSEAFFFFPHEGKHVNSLWESTSDKHCFGNEVELNSVCVGGSCQTISLMNATTICFTAEHWIVTRWSMLFTSQKKRLLSKFCFSTLMEAKAWFSYQPRISF